MPNTQSNTEAASAIKSVAILGASPNPDRYAWLALQSLRQHQHPVFLVSSKYTAIDGIDTYRSLAAIPDPIHTVTVYLNPTHLAQYVDDILSVKPVRVIFNPGSESAAIAARLQAGGIEVEMACTLVLLRTGQF